MTGPHRVPRLRCIADCVPGWLCALLFRRHADITLCACHESRKRWGVLPVITHRTFKCRSCVYFLMKCLIFNASASHFFIWISSTIHMSCAPSNHVQSQLKVHGTFFCPIGYYAYGTHSTLGSKYSMKSRLRQPQRLNSSNRLMLMQKPFSGSPRGKSNSWSALRRQGLEKLSEAISIKGWNVYVTKT